MKGVIWMEKVINKLEQWLREETKTLNTLAHKVATAKTVDAMVKAKNSYDVQDARTEVIIDAIGMIKDQK